MDLLIERPTPASCVNTPRCSRAVSPAAQSSRRGPAQRGCGRTVQYFFEGNARYKAAEYARKAGLLALADDTGLVVDALDGRPGVYSARYAGPDATDRDRYLRILREMADVPDELRSARSVCVLAVVSPM
ncbi:MAG: non-canonical purine NTP pyrophosphatase [Anaerolineae bacterium]